jgi:predicted HTH domain antitoxin
MDADELMSSMRKDYGLKLFQEGKLTLSQSAEFCGMNMYDFMSLLSLSGIPVIGMPQKNWKTNQNNFNL